MIELAEEETAVEGTAVDSEWSEDVAIRVISENFPEVFCD